MDYKDDYLARYGVLGMKSGLKTLAYGFANNLTTGLVSIVEPRLRN